MTAATSEGQVGFRKRRTAELLMLVPALALGFGGYALTHLDIDGALPAQWPWVLGIWVAMGLVAHLIVRFRLPYADPLLLPITFALTGIGVAMIHRIDLIPDPVRNDAQIQLLWVGLGIVALGLAAFFVRDYTVLQRYPYVLFCVGLALLLLPLVPGLGVELNGSQIWIRVFGMSFQPAEVSKIVLSLAFASYLVEKRDVLALAGPRILGFTIPRPRDLGPILVMFVASMLVLVYQRDLGTALLFFGLFVAMLYVATGRGNWVALGGVLMAAGGVLAYQFAGHVRVRISAWLDPFSNVDQNYQVIQAQFGFAWGGLVGRGWGLGRPGLTPLSKSDFITAAVGEELGIVGLMAIVVLYALLVARGLRTALTCHQTFGKLLAAGLSFVFAIQVFAIVGGVTRLLPLTGLTTPFMSQGGSSMVANWIVLSLLLVISHQARKPQVVAPDAGGVAELSADATQVISARPEPRPAPHPQATPAAPYEIDDEQRTELVAAGGNDATTQFVPTAPADEAPTQFVPAPPADEVPTQLVDASPSPGAPDQQGPRPHPRTSVTDETQALDPASIPTPPREEETR